MRFVPNGHGLYKVYVNGVFERYEIQLTPEEKRQIQSQQISKRLLTKNNSIQNRFL